MTNDRNGVRQARGFQIASRVSTTTEYGWFYFFIRRSGAGGLGHIGWGFQFNGMRTSATPAAASGSYTMGSLENISGWPVRGGEGSASAAYWWIQRSGGPSTMMDEMRTLTVAESRFSPSLRVQTGMETVVVGGYPESYPVFEERNPNALTFAELQQQASSGALPWARGSGDSRIHITPYDAFKGYYVANPKPNEALREARRWDGKSFFQTSYSVIAQNCMDNANDIAHAFGVRGLPWRPWNFRPNGYFNAIDNHQSSGNL